MSDNNNEKAIDKFWNFIGMIMRWVLNLFLKPFHKELSESAYESLLQFVKFGVVGVSNTLISYGIYAISLFLFKKYNMLPSYDFLVAQYIAFFLSVLWSFYWNNKMVFIVEEGKSRNIWKALLKTYISYSFTGLLLTPLLLLFWVKICNISDFIAPLINVVICVPINFIINKLWAFSTKDKEKDK